MISIEMTNVLLSLFIFCLGLSFLLERSGFIKQLYNDWKKRRQGRTLSQQWKESDKDRKGEEAVPRSIVGEKKIASHPPFFSLLLLLIII